MFMNYESSFNNINKRHITEIANYIWDFKDYNTNFTKKWETLNKTKLKLNTHFGCRHCNSKKIKFITKITKQ